MALALPGEEPAPAAAAPSEEPFAENADGPKEFYGVHVNVPQEVIRLPGGYLAAPLSDREAAEAALSALRDLLSLFPDGFFERLCTDGFSLDIRLCKSISGDESSPVPRPGAVTTREDGRAVITLSAADPADVGRLAVHELCHAVDMRLDRLSESDPSHWNAEDWAALNPPGFAYYGAYRDPDGVPYSESGDKKYTAAGETEPERVYFVSRYARTYASEDSAALVEALYLYGPRTAYFRSPHIARKLAYYFAAIRYYLDPEGSWTGPTFWEEKLDDALKA